MQENASLQLAEQNHCSRTKYANKARSKYGDKAVATVLQTELQRLKEKLQHRNIVSQECQLSQTHTPTLSPTVLSLPCVQSAKPKSLEARPKCAASNAKEAMRKGYGC